MSPDLRDELQQALGHSYRFERELSGGGMSRVFVATEVALGRQVVVKVLPPALSAEVSAERFRREIQIAAQLHHPHIVPVFTAGESTGVLYYTMPYVEGESLRSLLSREKQLPVERALQLAREIADALDFAHTAGVVHRDIKPENILLAGGHAVITDFGIARALSRSVGEDTLTGTGLTIGTPAYMSPEQASGETEIDGRSDIYSLGCVLYEMLAGEPPFTGPTQQAVIAKRFAMPAPSLRVTRQLIPETLDRVVSQALARAPADRFQTGREFAEALVSKESQPQPFRSRAKARRVLPYVLAAALIGLAAYAAASRLRPGGAAGRATVTHSRATAIAVLPFANLSADPENAFFADGMTEELINALAHIRGLRVAARTSVFSLRGQQLDARTVGDTLDVGAILEGSVRRAGDSLRVTARLVNTADGYQLWSEDYDRALSGVFELQNEIAGAIVAALRPRFTHTLEIVETGQATSSLPAYEEYLRGRAYLASQGVRGLPRALGHFQEAAALDPSFARAHAGIATARARLAALGLGRPQDLMPLAKTAALRALTLDSTLASAHVALAHILMVWELDAPGAERAFARAITLDHDDPEARYLYGILLLSSRRFDEASREFHLAHDLEPLLPHTNSLLGRYYITVGRPDDAIRYLQNAIRLGRNIDLAYQQLGHAYLQKRMTRNAIDAFHRAAALSGGRDSAHLAYAYGISGNRIAGIRILQDLESAASRRYQSPVDMAIGYAGVGMPDQALEWLARAFEERAAFVEAIDVISGLEPIRGDPRFVELSRKVGFANH